MTPEEKSDRFWELMRNAQRGGPEKKWARVEDLSVWLQSWGGKLKKSNRARKGYIVRQFTAKDERFSYEVPEEFVDRCLVLDSLP